MAGAKPAPTSFPVEAVYPTETIAPYDIQDLVPLLMERATGIVGWNDRSGAGANNTGKFSCSNFMN